MRCDKQLIGYIAAFLWGPLGMAMSLLRLGRLDKAAYLFKFVDQIHTEKKTFHSRFGHFAISALKSEFSHKQGQKIPIVHFFSIDHTYVSTQILESI